MQSCQKSCQIFLWFYTNFALVFYHGFFHGCNFDKFCCFCSSQFLAQIVAAMTNIWQIWYDCLPILKTMTNLARFWFSLPKFITSLHGFNSMPNLLCQILVFFGVINLMLSIEYQFGLFNKFK